MHYTALQLGLYVSVISFHFVIFYVSHLWKSLIQELNIRLEEMESSGRSEHHVVFQGLENIKWETEILPFTERNVKHIKLSVYLNVKSKSKAVPLHAMEALGGRGGIAHTHSRPRH
jgi:hypothetical protein